MAPSGRLRRRRCACFARGPHAPRRAVGASAAAPLQRRLAAPRLGRCPRLPIRLPLKEGAGAVGARVDLAARSKVNV